MEGACGADLDARGVFAMIAAEDAEMTARIRERALFDVFDPGAEDADGDLMLFLAGHRAGVTPDTSVLVDDKTVWHGVNGF